MKVIREADNTSDAGRLRLVAEFVRLVGANKAGRCGLVFYDGNGKAAYIWPSPGLPAGTAAIPVSERLEPSTGTAGQRDEKNRPGSSTQGDFPVLLTVAHNLWLPVERGTGFSGPAWMTPLFPVRYNKITYKGTKAIQVTRLNVKYDKGQIQSILLTSELALSDRKGEFLCEFMDPPEWHADFDGRRHFRRVSGRGGHWKTH